MSSCVRISGNLIASIQIPDRALDRLEDDTNEEMLSMRAPNAFATQNS